MTFLQILGIDFLMRFVGTFSRLLDRKWSRSGPPNRSKILKKYVILPPSVVLMDLGTFWHQFGTIFVRFG